MKSQKGVALIAVMLVLAIVVVVAVTMSGRLQLQLQRQFNIMERQQALWIALGAEEYSRVLLKRTVSGKENVNLQQDWAVQGATFPIEQGVIRGKITDLQSCFNLNAVQKGHTTSTQSGGRSDSESAAGESKAEQSTRTPSPAAQRGQTEFTPEQQALQRVLETAAGELTIPVEYLVARLKDWLDADNDLQSAGGAEENDYAALEFPYYTANSLMVSKSELRVLLDMTVADYQLIAPLLCVIPQQTLLQVNVNTLTDTQASLLAALIPGLNEDSAASLITARPAEGFTDLEQFFSSSQLSGLTLTNETKALFSIKSQYFQAELNIQLPDSSFQLTSVFKVDDNQVQVVARRFGGPG